MLKVPIKTFESLTLESSIHDSGNADPPPQSGRDK